MWYLLIGIVILGLISACIGFYNSRKMGGEEISSTHSKDIPQDCCGQHELCERDSLLAAVSKQIEYYDDEELDFYRGVDASMYTESAIDEFREVLYTLKDIEVAGWVRSLQLREINLPDKLKDEVLLIIGERRL